MNKAELRSIYLQKRTDLSAASHGTKENAVIEALFELPEFPEKKVVHIYLPLKHKNEINTWKIIEKLWKQDRDVVVPGVLSNKKALSTFVLQPQDEIETVKWGLSEPRNKRYADVNKIDAIILPLLCFDEKGYRVGYGKGFYDRFLSTLHSNVLKIGLSLFNPVLHIEDINTWDIPLDIGITPSRIYRFYSINKTPSG